MSSKDEKKAILDRLLKKYNSRSAKNIDTNRRIIVKPAEIYKNYPQNNAEIAKKQCLNEAASSLLELGFVAVDYLKFSEDIEKIYLCEEKLDAIYEYLKKEYQVVPQSAVSRQIQETVKKYRVAGGPMVQRYCEEVLRQAEDPRLTMVPERIAANLKMIDFLEQNQENLYAREASMLVYGDSKWFEDNNREEVCTFLRGATETPREDSEKNDAILGLFYIAPAEQEIFIKGSWNIAWEQYSLETSKLQGGLAITSGDLQRIQRITVTSPAVLTVENKASYQRIQSTDCAMMYLGGFAGRHQIQFLRKVIHDNPDVKYQHFGDIDVGGFLIHRHLCRETGQDFALYCMGIEQLKDARFQNCLKALTDSDRSRLETLTRDASYSGVLNYMKEHNVKLEQEIVSYYLEKDRGTL